MVPIWFLIAIYALAKFASINALLLLILIYIPRAAYAINCSIKFSVVYIKHFKTKWSDLKNYDCMDKIVESAVAKKDLPDLKRLSFAFNRYRKVRFYSIALFFFYFTWQMFWVLHQMNRQHLETIDVWCSPSFMKHDVVVCYNWLAFFEVVVCSILTALDIVLQVNLFGTYNRVKKPFFEAVKPVTVIGNKIVDQNNTIAYIQSHFTKSASFAIKQ